MVLPGTVPTSAIRTPAGNRFPVPVNHPPSRSGQKGYVYLERERERENGRAQRLTEQNPRTALKNLNIFELLRPISAPSYPSCCISSYPKMSSLTTAWSPGSFQLRLAFRCGRLPPAVILRTRLKTLDHQIRVCCVARSGNGVEHLPGVHSVSGSCSPADPFSGWSSSNGGTTGPSRDYRRTQWLTGVRAFSVLLIFRFLFFTFFKKIKFSIFVWFHIKFRRIRGKLIR